MPALKAAGLVESVHGIGGGYRLTREPEDYTSGRYWSWRRPIWHRSPACSRTPGVPAGRGSAGRWACGRGFYKLTRDYFTHITLADLMNAPAGDNYVI